MDRLRNINVDDLLGVAGVALRGRPALAATLAFRTGLDLVLEDTW